MKTKINQTLDFLTPNFIPEKNEMDMHKACILTSRTSNAQLSYIVFGFDVSEYNSQITPYYLKLNFAVDVFL